jgi:hypothetical protein
MFSSQGRSSGTFHLIDRTWAARAMTSRRKWMILAGVVVALAIGAELAVRSIGSSAACVQVVNESGEPIEDLVLSYAGTTLQLGTVATGQSIKGWFSASDKGPLRLGYAQKGNGIGGFEVSDYDPGDNRRNGSMLVLVVRLNQVDRYVDKDESIGSPQGILGRMIDSIEDDVRAKR